MRKEYDAEQDLLDNCGLGDKRCEWQVQRELFGLGQRSMKIQLGRNDDDCRSVKAGDILGKLLVVSDQGKEMAYKAESASNDWQSISVNEYLTIAEIMPTASLPACEEHE